MPSTRALDNYPLNLINFLFFIVDTRFMTFTTHRHEQSLYNYNSDYNTQLFSCFQAFFLCGVVGNLSASGVDSCFMNSRGRAFPGAMGTHREEEGHWLLPLAPKARHPRLAVGNSPPVTCYSHLAGNCY